eukprot:GFYU01006322.1.p1 GENE.GFYU01006322.1~~GFYU01006322.1.p1  ORF type:complete len:157 (-),score=32.65 GFYU01006322.1:585-986(-)
MSDNQEQQQSESSVDVGFSLHSVVKSTREAVQGTCGAVEGTKDQITDFYNTGVEHSSAGFQRVMDAYKQVRHENAPLLAAGIGTLVMIPSIRFGPRIFLRNTLFTSAGIAAFLYPEALEKARLFPPSARPGRD